jgi:hypothetical protein
VHALFKPAILCWSFQTLRRLVRIIRAQLDAQRIYPPDSTCLFRNRICLAVSDFSWQAPNPARYYPEPVGAALGACRVFATNLTSSSVVPSGTALSVALIALFLIEIPAITPNSDHWTLSVFEPPITIHDLGLAILGLAALPDASTEDRLSHDRETHHTTSFRTLQDGFRWCFMGWRGCWGAG